LQSLGVNSAKGVRLRLIYKPKPNPFSRVDAKRLQVTDFSRFDLKSVPAHFSSSRFDPEVPRFSR